MSFDEDSQQDPQAENISADNISFDSNMFDEDSAEPAESMDVPEPGRSTYHKRKRNNTDDVDKEIILKSLTEQQNEQKCDDADELYAKTVTAMLKTFPKNIKNEAKVYIMQYL